MNQAHKDKSAHQMMHEIYALVDDALYSKHGIVFGGTEPMTDEQRQMMQHE